MDVLWSKEKLYKIFSKDSLPMTFNAHASGDGSAMVRCCRLCGGDSSLRGFNESYISEGVEERYDHLLYDCFGIMVYPSDCLICDHCVRQLRNINRFRTLVHAAFAKQRSEYSSKHSQMGTGEGYCTLTERKDDNNRIVNSLKEVVKLRKRSKLMEVPKRREMRRDRRGSATNVIIKRMNIPCNMCKQRYPMLVPFEGWKEFICSRCKKNRESKTSDRRNRLKMVSTIMRDRLVLNSKADLRGRSRICCVSKKSTQLSKMEVTPRAQQQKYQCTICPKKYVVAQHLTHHMTTVHGTKDDVHNMKCSVCSKDLKSKESLEKHTRMHTGQPVYQCDVCLRIFKGKRSFQTHYLAHGK